jgi:hypothetical protein
MRESCTSGSVRGVLSNEHPYRDRAHAKLRRCKNSRARDCLESILPTLRGAVAAERCGHAPAVK